MAEQPSPPLANSPEARTPDGTLKDTTSPPLTPTPTPSSQPNDPAPKPSIAGAPDTYTFTPPAGTTFDDAAIAAATPIFRELNLSQASADKLVGFYNEQMKAAADTGSKAVLAMREKWVTEVKTDPELGGKLDTIKADIGRAFDALGDSKLVTEFKTAMDLTGAGDNPAFIKAFWKLSQKLIEGKSVIPGGPSPLGQSPGGKAERPSLASAMYPNLARTNQ
jgi:hypothetical protein